jgi:hypothetical protein
MSQHDVLHEKHEEFHYWLSGRGPQRLFSALDMIGTTLKATCTKCGRWQTAVSLTADDAKKILASKGWKLQEEICPKCVANG